jgi:phosphonate transport system substrate-binding protein
VFFPVQSNAAQIEAMRSGRLHISGFNTGSNPLAVACAGFRPFTIMAADDGSFGYEMEIITYPGSGIETVEDIKGSRSGLHLRDVQLGLQGAVRDPQGRVRHEAGEDFEAGLLGQA